MNFGKTIYELRKKNGKTQEELAAELGVTAAAVSKWENGYSLPDIMMLCALADYFQVTTDELLGRNVETKYAVIVTENQKLGERIRELAKQYGFCTVGIFTDRAEAAAAAQQDERVRYLLAGIYQGGFFDDSPLQKLVSISPTDDEIITGFQWVFENCAHGDHSR